MHRRLLEGRHLVLLVIVWYYLSRESNSSALSWYSPQTAGLPFPQRGYPHQKDICGNLWAETHQWKSKPIKVLKAMYQSVDLITLQPKDSILNIFIAKILVSVSCLLNSMSKQWCFITRLSIWNDVNSVLKLGKFGVTSFSSLAPNL